MASCKTFYPSLLSDTLAKVFDRNAQVMPDGKTVVKADHPLFTNYYDELVRLERIATALGFSFTPESPVFTVSKRGEYVNVFSAVVNKGKDGKAVIQWLDQSVALDGLPENILVRPAEKTDGKTKKTLMYVEYGDEDGEFVYLPLSLKFDEVPDVDEAGKPIIENGLPKTKRVYPEFETIERSARKGKLVEYLAEQVERPMSLADALEQEVLKPGVYEVTEVKYTKFKPMIKINGRYFKANSKLTEALSDRPEVSAEKPAKLSLVGLKKDENGVFILYNGYKVVDLDFLPHSAQQIALYTW